MDTVHRRVLESVVERYDDGEQPVTRAEICYFCALEEHSVEQCFETLERNYLIAPVDGDGYRPTVTGRELLELDLDDGGLLILDTDPQDER